MSAKNNSLDDAWKIQLGAAEVGFDWPHIDGVFDKVKEELEEVREVWHGQASEDAIELELGDLLFAVVNLCRVMEFHPETALVRTNLKFTTRFERMCEGLAKSGKEISNASLDEMERMWEWAKGLE
jgi:uncharacterized protein YabN with tetrapyrrole methylase and pyrophosphatase domain